MKKIFVSVKEFLDNGGVLEKGVVLYNSLYNKCGTFRYFNISNGVVIRDMHQPVIRPKEKTNLFIPII